MTRTILAAMAMLLAWACALPAAAHFTPNSEIRLDFGRERIAAEIVVPIGELGYAIGRSLPTDGPALAVTKGQLGRYLMSHMSARTADGRPWTLTLDDLTIVDDGSQPDMRARVSMRPPAGASPRRFDLAYSAVIERVPNHVVLVLARSDVDAGRLSVRPEMIGGLQSAARILRIDRGPGNAWRGLLSAIGLGMGHIAEGHDHLLFLTALLLPAPLLAGAGRWTGYGGLRFTARRLVGVVTAFTVGHSLTLIGGAFFGWHLPTRPVEVGIALSILVSAVHAWRPLFAGREPWVAAGFGLVHGLAFATLIGRFGLEPLQKAQSILGFNLGIEFVQLAVVAAVTPALILLARTPRYTAVRLAGAALAGFSATAWIVERLSGDANPVGRAIDAAFAYAPWLLAALTIGAVAATLRRRRQA